MVTHTFPESKSKREPPNGKAVSFSCRFLVVFTFRMKNKEKHENGRRMRC